MNVINKTVQQLSDMLKNKEISSYELTCEYLKEINTKNKAVNAYITICTDEALAEAQIADAMLSKGTAYALTGIPVALKDNICTAGVKTTCASKMLRHYVPAYDATVVDRLHACGAVVLGKNNMDEFAMGSSSQSSFFGGVKNPYDLNRIPGGSSGGSAAAVAANLCAAALGTDTGGSVRQPAAMCGVTGIKPTYGSVSRYGIVAFAASLEQIGPICKTANDCAIILNCISGSDDKDTTVKNSGITDYRSRIGESLKGKIIGLPKEYFGDYLDKEVRAAVLNAARAYEEMGCVLREVSIPAFRFAVPAYYIISSVQAASSLSRYNGVNFGYFFKNSGTYDEFIERTRSRGFGDEVKRRILLGNYVLSEEHFDSYYKRAVSAVNRLKQEYTAVLDECDFIITPTSPGTANMINAPVNSPSRMYCSDLCTVSANLTGLPAISTVCGYNSDNMPVGFSITGKPFDEATIIGAADAFEQSFTRRKVTL